METTFNTQKVNLIHQLNIPRVTEFLRVKPERKEFLMAGLLSIRWSVQKELLFGA